MAFGQDGTAGLAVRFVAALLWAWPVGAADLTIQTVDGLGRPLADVGIRISCFAQGREVSGLAVKSDAGGHAQAGAACKSPWVRFEKPGYRTAEVSGLRERNVLKRIFAESEVGRIAALPPEDQLRDLRELLAGNDLFPQAVFRYEGRLIEALRVLVRDPLVTGTARRLLARIGLREDLRMILRLPEPPEDPEMPERWRYDVAAALISPETPEAWEFLRRCASGQYKDGKVAAGAIQSLRLTATPQSRKVLGDVFPLNTQGATQIAKAMKYISDSPVGLSGPDLEALARNIAPALDTGTWLKNGAPVFDEAGDKAMVPMEYRSEYGEATYEATFHRTAEGWLFRGAREKIK